MDELMNTFTGGMGAMVWLLWLAIGCFSAVVSARYMPGRKIGWILLVGAVSAVLGGYLTVNFLGDSPVQLFLLSLLGCVFFCAAALWLFAALTKGKKNGNK